MGSEAQNRPNRSDEEGRRRIGDRAYRLLEMVPGAVVWLTLVLAVLFSFFAPLVAIYFIIIFDLFWLFRVTYFVIFLIASWRRYRRDVRIDWVPRAVALPRFGELYHLVFLPTYKEDIGIIRTTMRSLVAAAYPGKKDRFIIVHTGEESDKERFLSNARIIEEEFGKEFFRFVTVVHPIGLPGELRGKGSNIHHAGERAKELIDSLGIPYENVVVSSFDIDTCVHPQYFAHLAFKYLTHPNPTRASYQPIALYNNNMWDAPALIRVAAFGTTFWLMTELTRPERLFTFSSHSMSFKALVDVGFWQKDIVTEDSRIFLQCLVHYDGDYAVVPMYMPVSMDTVMADTWGRSLKNLYLQQRRWAWGVEHFPYLMSRFWKNPRFPLRKKIFHVWTLAEGMYTWATAPLMIFILGYLPFWVAPDRIRTSVLFQNTPHMLETLMRLALVGVLVSAVLSFSLLPPMPTHRRPYEKVVMFFQWALVPVTFILFGSIPAIDAQTRLMLGKYLGFNVTEKKRKDPVAADPGPATAG
ncbi:MAG TPA: glycosyltransferase family 2 protein [Candidatus Eisenbacteria bacterium]|nr:glycosyltransferase family 2 protein [Candidatus Eisenbacteria bacterium]